MKKSTLLKSVILSIMLFFNISNNVNAADYYWVNGTGNWSDFLGHWATTSGGAINHIQAPGSSDNVIFDANSFALPLGVVTVDALATCNNMTWTGVTNNPDFSGFSELDVFGSLTFSPLMTTSYTGQLKFKSSNPGNTVDFSVIPLTINQIEFSGTGEWSIISNIDVEAIWGQITVAGGTVNFNNNIYKLGALQSWDMGIPRIINLGGCTMDIQWFWIMNPSTVDFNAGTSTLNIKNNWFSGNGLTYYNVNFPLLWPGDVQIQDGNVFHNLGLTDPNVTGLIIDAGKIQTIYDIDFGATCANRKTVRSNSDGLTATIKKVSGSVTENYLNIKDISVIGGATFTTNNGINMGNVTNWTINASVPTTYYWVGETGNWSDPDHWALSSGAAYPSGNTCVPADVDNVIFDVNSFTVLGGIVTLNTNAFCKNMTWTGVANNPSLNSSGAGGLFVYGSLTLDPLMIYNSFYNIYFLSNVIGNTITTAGKIINSSIYFDGSGDWTLQDNLQFSMINHNKGTFNLNNKNITGSSYYSYTPETRTLNLGSSNITLNSAWDINNGTNFTLNAGTSVINLSGWQFNGGSKIYNNVNLSNLTNTFINGSNTFQTLNNSGAGDLQLTSGSTQTILTDFTSTGTCSDLIQLTSSVSGTTASISKASGIITINYIAIKDIAATGGATFNANNSIDNGNVSGINFTALASQNYYWIGGSGNWSNPSKWSLSSGGPANPGGCIPTQVDNVFFDAASALAGQTVTVNQAAYCNNMNWTGVSVNATFSGVSSLDVYGDFILSNMAYSFTGDLNFKATDLGNNINTSGRTLNNNNIYFSGVGEWMIQNSFTSSASRTIYLNSGTIRTNNFNLTGGYIYSFTSNNRLLDMGSSLVSVSSWYISDGTNMSVLPGTSTLTVTSSSYFVGGGLNFNNVNILPVGIAYVYGSNTFNTLNIPNCTSLQIENGTTQTFNNIIFPNGTGCTSFFNLSSSITGSPANFSMPAGVLNKNWLSITDITAGGGATFNATNSQGIGSVTGWVITSSPAVDYYWVGNTGNWNEPIHWSLSSGGVPNPSSCIPGPEDNVFFDVNSFTLSNQTATINVVANCKNMNWTGVINDPNLGGWMQININGSLTLNSNINMSGNSSIFNFSSSLAGNTIFTAGKIINGILFSGSGTYTLSDDLATNWSGIQFNNGILNTNNFDIYSSNGSFTTNSSSVRTLNLGSSTINVATWDAFNTTGLTFNTGTSEIIINGNGWQFNGGNLIYNNVTIYPNPWTFNFNGSNTFNKLTLLPGNNILFEAGKTQNTSDFIALGAIGNEITLKSATDGVTSGINQVVKEFCGDKLIIKDMAVSGNTFYAGLNSINQGNNSGWTWSGVTAIDQYPAPLCETVPGGGSVSGINLTLLEPAIDGGSGSTFSWFEDPALTIPVVTPTSVTINDGTDFYAQVNDGTCSNVASVTYTVLPKPILSFAVTNVTCFGSNDGSINMTVSGGTPSFTYLWTGGLITEDIASLVAGTYNVTVTDANLCSSNSSAIVNQPAILAGTITAVNVTVCNGNNNGSITINGATGGGGTYQYSINGGLAWQASNSFTNLFTGTYDVRIRDAAATTCVITLNAALVITQPTILSGTVSKTDVTCFGASNGSITIGSSAGGSGTFEYSINGGLAWQASNTFSNIAAGTYNVQIRDLANPTCVIVLNAAYAVNQPLVLTATVTPTNITICYGNNNGSIVMSAPAGGSGNYEYSINGGTNWQASPSFTNLTAGTYNVQIRDANAITCIITLNAALVLSQPAILSATVNSTNVTCFNGSDGIISITLPTGGGGTYQYSNNGGTSWQAGGTFNGLIAGTYDVRIRDAANTTCVITLNAALVISQPNILAATITPVNVTVCNGNNNGSITINGATGGGGTYQYSINGGLAWQASNSFTNLFTGTYDVRIRDAAATTCVITLNAALVITQPTILSGTVSKTDVTCFGASNGSITIGSSAGGSGTFEYSINGGIAWQASNTFSNIAAGTYNVQIRDMANPTCIIVLNAAYAVNQPLALTATVTPTDITICYGNNNGSIVMSSPAGGSGNYEYSINGGTNWQGSSSFTNLTAGTYNVQIRDANAITCIITLNAALVLSQPAILSATVNSTNVTCFNGSDGSINITLPTGGGGTYQYTINGGTSWQASGTFNGLIAGTYDVRIRDAANPTCIIILNAALAINQPIILAASTTVVNVSCNGGNNGNITVNGATGGSGTYQYSINGGTSWQASNSFNNLIAGTYDVRIRDANAITCEIIINSALVISQPAALVASSSATEVLCYAQSSTVTVSAVGGTLPYSGNGTFTVWAGTHNYTVTDANSCTSNTSIVVTEPSELVASSNDAAVLCYGGNATVIVSATGGTVPYSGVDTFIVAAGTHFYTVTDDNACTSSTSSTVTEPDSLVASSNATAILCNGGTSTITVSATGGTLPYSGVDTFIVTTGTYNYTVTDSNSCTSVTTVILSEPAALVASSNATAILCNGGNSTVSVSAIGGTLPYSGTGSFTVVAGTHNYSVTDANSCSSNTSVVISEPSVLAALSGSTAILCNGGNSTVTVSATGGTLPYSGTGSFTVAAGTHFYTVTDANACTSSTSSTVTEPDSLIASSNATAILCNGGNSTVIISATGGTLPYSGIDTIIVTTGIYNYTVTDANACTSNTSVIVAEPSALVASSSATEVLCYAQSSTVTVSATGGTLPYSGDGTFTVWAGTHNYTVTDANSCTSNTSVIVVEPSELIASSNDAAVLCNGGNATIIVSATGGTVPYSGVDTFIVAAGTHFYTVTDANACTSSTSSTVTEPAIISINIATTNVSVFGGSDGTINITVTGGDSTYSYNWSNSATTEDITGLIAGTYSVTVTDGNLCSATNTTLITQPSAPGCDLSINATVLSNVSCNGANNGMATVQIINDSNPVTPYLYSWEDANSNVISSSDTVYSLAPGQYVIVVMNNDLSCTTIDTIQITEPDALTLSLSATNITCNGAANGSITAVSGGGGTGAHYYNWSNSETTSTINNLSAGWYILTVTDANNCTIIDSVEITEPDAVDITITANDITCFGLNNGLANASVTGGNGIYSYNWSNGETNASIDTLSAGWYFVIVNDTNNCASEDSIQIFEPEILALSLNASMISCASANNGLVTATVTGGTTPYSYNWSNGDITDTINDLSTGNYILTVTDANLCIIIDSVEITEPDVLSIILSANTILCNGETTDVTTSVSGGTLPYSYLWSGGETSESLTGVTANTFMVTITDANGCDIADTLIVTEPDSMSVNASITNALCNGTSTGSVTIAITGGTLPINILWSTGEITDNISSLVSGNYDVTITDANGCTFNNSYSVSEPDAVIINSSVTNVSSFGGNDGAIDITVSGGDSNYSYLWSGTETTEDITGLFAGTYSVTVTDGNLCSSSHTSLVTQPSNPVCVLTIEASVLSNVVCHGANDGVVTVSITNDSNPMLPYSFFWTDTADNNISVNNTVSSLVAGQYMVVVVNSDMSCTAYDTVVVTEPDQLLAGLSFVANNCFGDTAGSISSTVTGGTPFYYYMWSTIETTDQINNLSAGWYSLTVTDNNNCTVVDSVEITEPAQLLLSLSSNNVTCFGLNNGSAVAVVNGGVSSYSYNWTGTETTDSISNLIAGWYAITVTDANFCSVVDSIEVMEPTVIIIDTLTNPASSGTAADGSIFTTVSGGTSPYSYLWSNGSIIDDPTNVTTGTYDLTVTDANGCIANTSVFVDFVDALSKTVAEELGISIYPNPTSGILNITGNKEASITIYDVTGKIIYNSLQNYAITTIDLSSLSDGTYLMKIISENKVINSKIIVRK